MQKSLKTLLLVIFSLFFIAIVLTLTTGSITDIQESHLSANLPNTLEEFQEILKRDLKKYFSTKLNRHVEIQYELLRKAPTQSGIAYPKFYAWVVVRNAHSVIESGAVRVAAIDKTKTEVTHFVSQETILKNQNVLNTIFPSSLCKTIVKKAQEISSSRHPQR